MKKSRFATFTYDVVDELSLGQGGEKIAAALTRSPEDVHIPSSVEMQDLSPNQVALQLYHPQVGFLKKYACYDPGLTELNIEFLLDKVTTLPDEIVKVASFYLVRAARNQDLEVPRELELLASQSVPTSNIVELDRIDELSYIKKLAACKKKKKPAKYALASQQKFPIDSEEDVEKASEYFDQYHKQFFPEERLEFAINTCNAAKSYGIKLAGLISKYGSLSANTFNPNVSKHIAMRKSYVTEDSDVYDELLAKHAELGVETTTRALEAIDRHFGLERLWGHQLADPVISTCELIKEAELEIDGKYVSRTDLNKILSKDVRGWVDDFTKKELEGPDGLSVLASLPEPTREGLLSEI